MEAITLREFLSETGRPWKKKRRGRPEFDASTRIMALLVKEKYGFTYRQTEIYLKENKQTCLECGMTDLPGHNTIWRTMTKLHKPYLKRLNHEVNQLFKKLRDA